MREAWELVEIIGRGGQAITWRARHRESGRVAAIKELRFEAVEDWKSVELFQREAAVLKQLEHPDIPAYIDAFTEEGGGAGARVSLFLVQEYVVGRSLHRELEAEGRWSEAKALLDLRRVLEILVYLHERVPAVVHRDIKPSNLLRREDGRLALVDFGAVQLQVGGTSRSTIIGTPGYMPMEQLVGRAEPRSDLYSLGVTFGQLLSGLDPTKIDLDGARLDFRPHVEGCRSVLGVIERLTEPDPGRRFRSAREALEALRAVAAGEGSAGSPSGGPDPATWERLIFGDGPPPPERWPARRAPSGFMRGMFGRWVVERDSEGDRVHPQVLAALRVGFKSLGRRTRFAFPMAASREVLVDPGGKVFLICEKNPAGSVDGHGRVLILVSVLDDGSMIIQHPHGSGGVSGRHWSLKGGGDLLGDYQRQLAFIKEQVPPERTVLTGMDIDTFLALYEPTWLGLPARPEDQTPGRPWWFWVMAILFFPITLSVLVSVVPIFGSIYVATFIAEWARWRDEVKAGRAPAAPSLPARVEGGMEAPDPGVTVARTTDAEAVAAEVEEHRIGR